MAIINSWKNKGLYPEKVIPSKKNIFEKGILKIYKIYQNKLLDLNACDFGDLILHCVNIFENNHDILEIYSNNFSIALPAPKPSKTAPKHNAAKIIHINMHETPSVFFKVVSKTCLLNLLL